MRSFLIIIILILTGCSEKEIALSQKQDYAYLKTLSGEKLQEEIGDIFIFEDAGKLAAVLKMRPDEFLAYESDHNLNFDEKKLICRALGYLKDGELSENLQESSFFVVSLGGRFYSSIYKPEMVRCLIHGENVADFVKMGGNVDYSRATRWYDLNQPGVAQIKQVDFSNGVFEKDFGHIFYDLIKLSYIKNDYRFLLKMFQNHLSEVLKWKHIDILGLTYLHLINYGKWRILKRLLDIDSGGKHLKTFKYISHFKRLTVPGNQKTEQLLKKYGFKQLYRFPKGNLCNQFSPPESLSQLFLIYLRGWMTTLLINPQGGSIRPILYDLWLKLDPGDLKELAEPGCQQVLTKENPHWMSDLVLKSDVETLNVFLGALCWKEIVWDFIRFIRRYCIGDMLINSDKIHFWRWGFGYGFRVLEWGDLFINHYLKRKNFVKEHCYYELLKKIIRGSSEIPQFLKTDRGVLWLFDQLNEEQRGEIVAILYRKKYHQQFIQFERFKSYLLDYFVKEGRKDEAMKLVKGGITITESGKQWLIDQYCGCKEDAIEKIKGFMPVTGWQPDRKDIEKCFFKLLYCREDVAEDFMKRHRLQIDSLVRGMTQYHSCYQIRLEALDWVVRGHIRRLKRIGLLTEERMKQLKKYLKQNQTPKGDILLKELEKIKSVSRWQGIKKGAINAP